MRPVPVRHHQLLFSPRSAIHLPAITSSTGAAGRALSWKGIRPIFSHTLLLPLRRLPNATIGSIQTILKQLNQRYITCQHVATMSAAQTQAVLPLNVLVQKTVSVAFGDRDRTCVLWTGVGDFQIKKEAILLVAENLGMSRRAARGATINPVWLDPVATFGMETGMVSPFLPPSPFADRHPSPIAALIVQAWSPEWEASKHVAISLSLYESLIVPLCALRSLLQNYYASKLPSIPRLFLS